MAMVQYLFELSRPPATAAMVVWLGWLGDVSRTTQLQWPTRLVRRWRDRRFRLVDPRRDRPHPHGLGRGRTYQVTRVGLVAQPAGVVAGCQYQRHPVVDFCDQLVGISSDHREGANPLARGWVLPVLPKPANAEWAVFHGDGIGLLGFLPFDRLPLEEAVNRDDAAPSAIAMPEGRQTVHGLALGVDLLSTSFWVAAPLWNKTPAQWVERCLASFMIAPDHQQGGRGVPFGRIVMCTAVAHIHAFDNAIA